MPSTPTLTSDDDFGLTAWASERNAVDDDSSGSDGERQRSPPSVPRISPSSETVISGALPSHPLENYVPASCNPADDVPSALFLALRAIDAPRLVFTVGQSSRDTDVGNASSQPTSSAAGDSPTVNMMPEYALVTAALRALLGAPSQIFSRCGFRDEDFATGGEVGIVPAAQCAVEAILSDACGETSSGALDGSVS